MAAPTRYPGGVSVTNKASDVKKEVSHKVRSIPINFADGTTETATGFTFPTDAIVERVYLYVKTAEATGGTKTIDVGTQGTSNDPDGFLVGASVANTGLVKGTLATGSETLGGLLTVESEAGTTDATVFEPSIAVGGDEVSWTPGSSDFAELEAEIIIEYKEVRDVN